MENWLSIILIKCEKSSSFPFSIRNYFSYINVYIYYDVCEGVLFYTYKVKCITIFLHKIITFCFIIYMENIAIIKKKKERRNMTVWQEGLFMQIIQHSKSIEYSIRFWWVSIVQDERIFLNKYFNRFLIIFSSFLLWSIAKQFNKINFPTEEEDKAHKYRRRNTLFVFESITLYTQTKEVDSIIGNNKYIE